MHTVFLSEPVIFLKDTKRVALHLEIELLSKITKQHGNANFDRLPTCPLCLERLDSSVTGMHGAPGDVSYSPIENGD